MLSNVRIWPHAVDRLYDGGSDSSGFALSHGTIWVCMYKGLIEAGLGMPVNAICSHLLLSCLISFLPYIWPFLPPQPAIHGPQAQTNHSALAKIEIMWDHSCRSVIVQVTSSLLPCLFQVVSHRERLYASIVL